ncbi:DUF3027 domain-containing protein [Solwaraspora sp. WMMA2056]|uniref:DUF3027 domain-containing protein n=1 Tax=Solwaraspora sp. WMMA2056 TaxID=3015161 RepID=UPI00259BB072|nr:DUF3027 domain-containing protein [Solwaraspora sp. WMMA2056]WJK41074.1 DUF3027 domain-containing protein [Solwaraspora sp. WMMA2056]
MDNIDRDHSKNRYFLDETHKCWVALRNRDTARADYHEEWYDEQCGSCKFWLPLAGELGADYGACANARSPFDGRVQFEHDGCDEFEDAGEWVARSSP